MAIIHELPAEGRKDQGKGASRRLRHAGKVPAIVYGGKQDPVSIQLDHNTALLASQKEWFYSAILDLKVNDVAQKVLLRDMQRHPFKLQILHMDFQRVRDDEAIRIRVPLHFLNQEKSAAGKMAGIVISHAITDVEISCLPKDLPEFIEVDLGELNVGDIVHLSDLKLPAGVDMPELRLGKEHDVAVVTAQEIKAEVEPVAAEGEVVPGAVAPAVAGAPAAAGAKPAAGGAKPAPGAAPKPAAGGGKPAAAPGKKDDKK